MFLFCNHALITKVSTLLDIYKGCQRRQVQNQMGHIQISITTKIIIFLKSGRKTFKTIFCALSITEKYINLVNILRKKRASPLQVWCLGWIARCSNSLFYAENSMETEEEGPSTLTSAGTPSPSTSQPPPSLPAPPTSISAPEDLSGSVAGLNQVMLPYPLVKTW